jgi:hypothetical protein
VPPEAPLPDAGGDADDHEDQAEQDHEVAEAGVEAEAVHEDLVVDRRALVVELVRRIERAVAREPDLHDDRRGQQHRPPPVDGAHVPSRSR